ncbi:MAG TPA: MFS transporter, partial [Thermodesulfobacteriota bacterium]|nr:MFS transporter [Thermodesulfobacteriota bacterium]
MKPYSWVAKGDVNAFFGLMLDNITNLVILSGLLIGVFSFPKEVVLFKMIPGTAIGILCGNLMFTYIAYRLMKKTGRSDITAMPLGVDTVSLFGYTLGIIAPVYVATKDAEFAWKVGTATIILTGLIKILLSFSSAWIKRLFPQAALLGSIAGVALLLIAFLPTVTLFKSPLVGFISLGIIFLSFFSRRRLIWGLPGALWAVIIGTAIYYGLKFLSVYNGGDFIKEELLFGTHFPLPSLGSFESFRVAFDHISIILPLSIANVIGGVDVTESAEVAGDSYDVRLIIFTEGITTLIGGLFGGVLQTTPYIGHPAYKKMGGRAGYTLATGLFIGLGGIIGYISFIANYLPQEVIVPILIFIGLEITSQAFRRVPENHAPAVAMCFIPAIANLVVIEAAQLGIKDGNLSGESLLTFTILKVLSNGFIVTALIWGACMVSLIDDNLKRSSLYLFLGAVFSLFGLMHSPYVHGELFLPWNVADKTPLYLSASYLILSVLSLWSVKLKKE